MRNSRKIRASFLFFLRGKCLKSTRNASILEPSRRLYCTAVLRLCFCKCKIRFSHDAAQLIQALSYKIANSLHRNTCLISSSFFFFPCLTFVQSFLIFFVQLSLPYLTSYNLPSIPRPHHYWGTFSSASHPHITMVSVHLFMNLFVIHLPFHSLSFSNLTLLIST